MKTLDCCFSVTLTDARFETAPMSVEVVVELSVAAIDVVKLVLL